MPVAGKDIPTLIAEITANLVQAETLTHGLSRSQFNWVPEPGRWSIGQNLAHLTIINGPDARSLRSAIEVGREQSITGIGPFHYAFLFRQFIASQEPPVKRKFKAPKYFEPPAAVEPERVIADYRRIAIELRDLAAQADGLHLDCVKVEISSFPPLLRALIKMPLGARFELLTAHDRRHLVQVGEVLRHPRFPGT